MLLPQNKPIVCSTPSKNQTQTNALSGVAALNVSAIQPAASSIGTTANTGNNINNINTVIASSQNLQHHTTTLSSLTTTPSSTLVPTTAPIAFAAVAKHNTSQQQADSLALMRQYSAFASTAVSSSGTTPAAVSTHNAQNLQHSSVINAMQSVSNPHTSVSIVTSSTTLSSLNSSNNNNNNNHNLISVSTSQHQSHNLVSSSTGLTNVLDNHSTFTSVAISLPTTLTFNNSVINSVSPVNSVVSSRASPSIISPKAQQSFINGSALSNQQFVMNSFTNTDSMSTLKTIAQEAINRAAGLENSISTSSTLPQGTLSDTRQSSLFLTNDTNLHLNGKHNSCINNSVTSNNFINQNIMESGTNEAHIPPLLGVAPLGPCPLKKEHQLQFQMMEAADYHLPTPSDSERLKTYLHRQPVPTPAHYPQVRHSITIFCSTIFYEMKCSQALADSF